MASQSSATPTCRFLNLPPELRNRIYLYVFLPPPSLKVDFLTASPPAKCIVLTCKTICAETKLLHRDAYRNFWEASRFFIWLPENVGPEHAERLVLSAASTMRADDIAHISSLRVGFEKESRYRKALTFERGVWSAWRAVLRLHPRRDRSRDLEEILLSAYSAQVWYPHAKATTQRLQGMGLRVFKGGWGYKAVDVAGEQDEQGAVMEDADKLALVRKVFGAPVLTVAMLVLALG